MIVVFPSPNHSPGSDTRQSPSVRVLHSGGISSESSPGCLVGFAVCAPVELHAEMQLVRRMNIEMMHILFMILFGAATFRLGGRSRHILLIIVMATPSNQMSYLELNRQNPHGILSLKSIDLPQRYLP
jgi:hypothetical protein